PRHQGTPRTPRRSRERPSAGSAAFCRESGRATWRGGAGEAVRSATPCCCAVCTARMRAARGFHRPDLGVLGVFGFLAFPPVSLRRICNALSAGASHACRSPSRVDQRSNAKTPRNAKNAKEKQGTSERRIGGVLS